ncbi:MAG: methylenetetrahydrofolate reductase [Planctomycetota bacterium]|nr:methylenetetrahydrofolate reductase [Planctomycetota bacterium]MDI6787303.1 methylenetetrahydrofolate reductase [Planctomycetota bacterium]
MKTDSNLEKVLASGEFAVTAELGPPRGADPEDIHKKAKLLGDCADAINITDNQTAIVRMSSIAAGILLKQRGLDPVIQIVTRDRNRIAIQSDVLGAAAHGINNVLCLSGDHQKFGDHPTSKNVFDIDSIQLIQMLKKMRDEKKFMSGADIDVAPRLFIGAAENPFADPFEFRVIRLSKKISAGTDFIQTQAVFDVEKFEEWMKLVRKKELHKKTHILAGVIPIKSAKMAKYMKENVAGLRIPDEIVSRMEKAKDVKEEGIKICTETIERVRKIEGVQGIHIMAVAWESIVPKIVERVGLLPRPPIRKEDSNANESKNPNG